MADNIQVNTRMKLAERIKKLPDIELAPLDVWNYGPCSHHTVPKPDCEYRACGGDLFSHQRVAISWLYLVKNGMVADAPGAGKTASAMGLLALLKQKGELTKRAIIITNTPVVPQWLAEFKRFAPGLRVEGILPGTSKKNRITQYTDPWDVLVVGFHSAIRDSELLLKVEAGVLITDDVDAILTHNSRCHRLIVNLSALADRTVVMNATVYRTNALELHAAMQPIGGRYLFGPKQLFEDRYIIKEWERDSKTGLNKSKVVGLRNGIELREKINPWVIRRNYSDISDIRMPSIAPPTEVWLDMHKAQRDKYTELQQGILRRRKAGQEEELKEVAALAAFSQPLDSKILTPTGWTTMGEVSVGDFVLSPTGKPVEVVGKSPVDNRDVYRVTKVDGSSTLASDTHLWNVYYDTVSKNKGKYTQNKVLPTSELINRGVYIGKSGKRQRKFWLPSVNLDTPEAELPVPPYVIGALLGDGDIGYSTPLICGQDSEIKERIISDLGDRYVLSPHKDGVYSKTSISYPVTLSTLCAQCEVDSVYCRSLCSKCYFKIYNSIRNNRKALSFDAFPKVVTNPLITKLVDLGLNTICYNKSIPESYLLAGYQQRLDLLRGLMDTDGSIVVSKDGHVSSSFTSVSAALASDVVAIVRSLGGFASLYHVPLENQEDQWTAHISMLSDNPFYLKRKADKWVKTVKNTNKIDSINYVGKMDVQCIMIDSEDHLYVTDDYIVTHNTYGGSICSGLPGLGEADGPQASSKLDWFMKTIQDEWLEEKVVVFVRNVGLVQALHARLETVGIKYATVWGKNKDSLDRQNEVKKFWEDPECRVIIGTTAMVRSINLQIARIACFIDTPGLTPANVTQALGRIRRAGSKHDRIFPFMLLIQDSQESRYLEVLQHREAISNFIWDDETNAVFEKLSPQELMHLILP